MTGPSDLPEGWRWARLGEVAAVAAGGSAPQDPNHFSGSFPFVRVQHLEQASSAVLSWDLITDEAVQACRLREFAEGTIVFPKSGASIRLEKRAVLPRPSFIVSHLCAVNTRPCLADQAYLFRALQATRFAAGITDGFPALKLSAIRGQGIPLPPLPEQRAIARVLGTVEAARAAGERALGAAEQLKRSLMQHLFAYGPVPVDQAADVPRRETELGPVPEGWEVVRLGEVIEDGPQNGLYKPASEYGDGVPILRIDDFGNDGDVVVQAPNRVRLAPVEADCYGLREDDLLVNRVNSLSHLGKTAMVGVLAEPTVFESNMMRFSVDRTRALPGCIFRWLTTPQVRNRLRRQAKRAVAQSSVNQGDVCSLLLPLPPLLVQREIAGQLSAVDEYLAALRARQAALDALFTSLLSKLMTGEVRVPVGAEEHA